MKIGDTIILEQTPAPPGTVLYQHGRNYVVISDLLAYSSSLSALSHEEEARVVRVGPPPRVETYEAFVQRMSTLIAGAVNQSGVSMEPWRTAQRRFGLSDLPVGRGVLVHRFDDDLTVRLGRARVVIGEPNHWPTYGEFTINRRSWVVQSGSWLGDYGIVGRVVEHDATTPDYLTRTPTAQDAEKILALKVRAWNLGTRAKSDHGWCSMFEQTMRGVGLTYTTSLKDVEHITDEMLAVQ